MTKEAKRSSKVQGKVKQVEKMSYAERLRASAKFLGETHSSAAKIQQPGDEEA